MKKCDKHHGDISYDETIYLECPLCRTAKYNEVVEENERLEDATQELIDAAQDVDDAIERAIKELKGVLL